MDIHVDIETLGVRTGSTIMEIGVAVELAVGFNFQLTRGLHQPINAQADTVTFHGAERMQAWRDNPDGLTDRDMMDLLHIKFKHMDFGKSDTIWMWRPAFDQTLLQDWADAMCMPLPWAWWQVKDCYTLVRTLMEALPVEDGAIDVEWPDTAHRAQEDAEQQMHKRMHYMGKLRALRDEKP